MNLVERLRQHGDEVFSTRQKAQIADRIEELEKQRDELLAAYQQVGTIGRYLKSEDDCISTGIDFAAYESGLSDAIAAVDRIFHAAIASVRSSDRDSKGGAA